jgi:hypothetical protein
MASRHICDADGGIPGRSGSHYEREGGADSFVTLVIVLGSAAVIVMSISSCLRQRTAAPMMQQQTIEMAKPVMPGQPMAAGMPCATAQPAMAYPAQYGAYPHYPQAGCAFCPLPHPD